MHREVKEVKASARRGIKTGFQGTGSPFFVNVTIKNSVLYEGEI